MPSLSLRRKALLIILAGLAVRLALAGALGFGVDEAYALAVTRTWQLSWFDHPPLAFWLAWATQQFFGADAPHILLRLPFVLLFCGSSWLLFRLTERLYGPLAGLWALVSFTLAPFFFLSAGGWVVPDGPLVFFLLLGANLVVKALFGSDVDSALPAWLGAGLCIGLAGLSKYLAVFFPLGLFAFLLLSPTHRFWLARPGPWLAAVLAALMLAPVIVWNAQHDWVSFAFQLGRSAPTGSRLRWDLMFTVLGGQAAYLMPWTFGGLIIAALLGLRHITRDSAAGLLLCASLPVIWILTLMPLRGAGGLPHWEMPGWLFLFPLLGRWIAELEESGKSLHRVTLGLSLATMGFLVLVGGSQAHYGWLKHVLPSGTRADPTHELVEWHGLREAMSQLPTGMVLIATHWMDGGRIARELPDHPVMVWTPDPRGFAFLRAPSQHLGQDAVIVAKGMAATELANTYRPYFTSMEPLPPVSITRAGHEEFRLGAVRGRGMKLAYPLPYPAR